MITTERLVQLETEVAAALDSAGPNDLEIVDYGEISTVLAAEGTRGPVVCKRLPTMTRPQLADYMGVFDEYIAALTGRGLNVAASEVRAVGADPVTPYCVQRRYDRLLTDDLRDGDSTLIERQAGRLVELVVAAVRDGIGLDAQVSNWAVDHDDLVYLDVTTPLMKDTGGRQRVNLSLFIASLPWLMRGPVRRFLLEEILSHYHAPRPVLLDAVANLHKERLAHAIPALLGAANAAVIPPITGEEATKYYKRDALMWDALQRLRRGDRWWQRRVRRRRYPFLLPGTIER